MQLKDKVVLITGSSLGIGRETAYKFAAEGCRVIVTYYEEKEDAEKAGNKCKEVGANDVLVAHLDVTDDKSIRELVEQVKERFGRIGVLINNAGICNYKLFEEQTFEEIHKEIVTNLEGTIKVTHACLSLIEDMVINVGSKAGVYGEKYMTTYGATKWGVRGFTKALAEEKGDIKVYVVNPAQTATRMGDFLGTPPEQVAQVIVRLAKEEYNLPSGADINIWEYVQNPEDGEEGTR